MIQSVVLSSSSSSEEPVATSRVPGRAVAAALWQSLKRGLFDPYRPELHYMRGPGPRWREKHLGASLKALPAEDRPARVQRLALH